MHALMEAMGERMTFEVDATNTGTSAIEAFALGHGVCQDFAHVFIAACRHLGIPARYASGYMLNLENPDKQTAGHAWAEVFVEDLGWVGFDPANAMCPTDAYVRLAVGARLSRRRADSRRHLRRRRRIPVGQGGHTPRCALAQQLKTLRFRAPRPGDKGPGFGA